MSRRQASGAVDHRRQTTHRRRRAPGSGWIAARAGLAEPASGIGHLPSRHAHVNEVWLELALIAADLLALAQSMLLTDEPDRYRAEPRTLRYRLLHMVARITRGQRKVFLR